MPDTNPPIIVLTVSGGVVQDVYCSNRQARVFVVDWDTEGAAASGEHVAVPVAGGTRRAAVVKREFNSLSELAGTDAGRALELHRIRFPNPEARNG